VAVEMREAAAALGARRCEMALRAWGPGACRDSILPAISSDTPAIDAPGAPGRAMERV